MWPFDALQTIAGIIVVVVGSVIAMGQWNIARQKTWREAAEGGVALAASLKLQLEASVELGRKERDLLAVQVQALQGQLSLVQRDHENDRDRTEAQIARAMRMNHRLQVQLDAEQARNVKLTQSLQAHLPGLPGRELAVEREVDPEDL